jgi:hypothetical protein
MYALTMQQNSVKIVNSMSMNQIKEVTGLKGGMHNVVVFAKYLQETSTGKCQTQL